MSGKKSNYKLVYGVGINDVNYFVCKTSSVGGVNKIIWTCPYYEKWRGMLRRCYSEKHQAKAPTYVGCTVDPDWLYLSNFVKWVDEQPNRDWQNCHLDKDLLVKDNKHYSPSTAVFVSPIVNTFVIDRGNFRGGCMLGVDLLRDGGWLSYRASCSDPFKVNKQHVGCFKTEMEAHLAWQAKKHEYACQLADLQSDEIVAEVLRTKYAPDKDWSVR